MTQKSSSTMTISRVHSTMTAEDDSSLSDDDHDYFHSNKAVDRILSQLTEQELELAARAASYDYLVSQTLSSSPVKSQQQQRAHAGDFVERFLASTSKPDKALQRIKATLAFRQSSNVDELRTAFDHDSDVDSEDPAIAKTKAALEHHLQSKSLYVQGYDKQGRATYVFITPNVQHHDEEWTLKAHLYTLERALACSRTGSVNAVIDFNGFSLTRHAPPMSIGKQFMQVFREHYTGAIHQIYLVDAPMAFYALWNVLKGLVGTNTREKIHFISSKQAPQRLGALYDLDQLPSWLGGTNDEDTDFDLHEYLYQTPFDAALGDAKTPTTNR